jgi:benzoyl-CoA reductase/2-hydroxyglutaryl-CoA dehydratase subunit BcrC/BadD/HgdB
VTALEELEAAFQARMTTGSDPAEQSLPQVACIGTSIPAEVIRASGFAVRWVVARPFEPTPEADAYLESGYGPEMRSILERVLSGELDDAVLLVLDRSFRDVFYYLKELVRLGLAPTLPPLQMVDLFLTQDLAVGQHNRGQVARLLAALDRVGGVRCTEERLRDQVAATNHQVHELQLLQQHRLRGAIDGTPGFRAMAAGAALEPRRHTELLGRLNADLDGLRDTARPRILLWTGEALFHDELHEALASVGGQVVDESDAWSASAQQPIAQGGDSPLDAIVAHAHRASVGPELRPYEARAERFRAALAAAAPDVVVFYVPPNDSLFGWDYPPLRDAAVAAGATPVLIRQDVLAAGGRDTVAGAVRNAVERAERTRRNLQEGGAA